MFREASLLDDTLVFNSLNFLNLGNVDNVDSTHFSIGRSPTYGDQLSLQSYYNDGNTLTLSYDGSQNANYLPFVLQNQNYNYDSIRNELSGFNDLTNRFVLTHQDDSRFSNYFLHSDYSSSLLSTGLGGSCTWCNANITGAHVDLAGTYMNWDSLPHPELQVCNAINNNQRHRNSVNGRTQAYNCNSETIYQFRSSFCGVELMTDPNETRDGTWCAAWGNCQDVPDNSIGNWCSNPDWTNIPFTQLEDSASCRGEYEFNSLK